MANYYLRDIPDELWRRVKAAAALRGQTVREVLLACLRALAAGEPSKPPPKPQRK